jgi:type III secretory pathway component EscR
VSTFSLFSSAIDSAFKETDEAFLYFTLLSFFCVFLVLKTAILLLMMMTMMRISICIWFFLLVFEVSVDHDEISHRVVRRAMMRFLAR